MIKRPWQGCGEEGVILIIVAGGCSMLWGDFFRGYNFYEKIFKIFVALVPRKGEIGQIWLKYSFKVGISRNILKSVSLDLYNGKM